jgi:hypothetical protein
VEIAGQQAARVGAELAGEGVCLEQHALRLVEAPEIAKGIANPVER